MSILDDLVDPESDEYIQIKCIEVEVRSNHPGIIKLSEKVFFDKKKTI